MAIKLVDKKSGNVNLTAPSGNTYPLYAGETTVIPKVEKQELETKNTILKENITVVEIPYTEVSNVIGGTTIVIA
jgi:uncharacterized protein YaaQ